MISEETLSWQHRVASHAALNKLLLRPDVKWSRPAVPEHPTFGRTHSRGPFLEHLSPLVEVRCAKRHRRAWVYPTGEGPLLVTSGDERRGMPHSDLLDQYPDVLDVRQPHHVGCRCGLSKQPLDIRELRQLAHAAQEDGRTRHTVVR